MASIIKRTLKSGDVSHVVRFRLGAQRRDLFLPALYSRDHVKEIAINVDRLARCVASGGSPDRRTEAFLATASEDLAGRLARVGLLSRVEMPTLGELWDRYIADSDGKKDSTVRTYVTIRARFFRFFGEDEDPRLVTNDRCRAWVDFCSRSGYAVASVAGCVQRAKAVFSWAIRKGLISDNPFDGIKRGSFVNEGKRVYIPMDWYHRMLDACPSQSWRTLLALCRVGGLRNPSETLLLRWTDVDWAGGRIRVTSPKTEAHAGKDSRLVPMFPELRIELDRQFEQSESYESPYVITHARGNATNLRTGLTKIIFLAGLEVWPDLYQNLRRSADIDISSRFPAHVAAAWLGHSPRVSAKHYLFPTEADYHKATVPVDENQASTDSLPQSSAK